jgi:hypothetical protein
METVKERLTLHTHLAREDRRELEALQHEAFGSIKHMVLSYQDADLKKEFVVDDAVLEKLQGILEGVDPGKSYARSPFIVFLLIPA